jgi:SMC interacting uncharacterized protein involved in chromosome segregation
MNAQIANTIQRLKEKFSAMKADLAIERNYVSQFQVDLQQMRALVTSSEERLAELESENQALQTENVQLKEQIKAMPVLETPNRDAEIDDLVREIDFCISQLKK